MTSDKKSLSSASVLYIPQTVRFGTLSGELHDHSHRWFMTIPFWLRRTPDSIGLKHFQSITSWELRDSLGS